MHERQGHHQQRQGEHPPAEPGRVRGGRLHGTRHDAGEQAAERPDRQQQPGQRLAAVLVGERDGGDLGAAEHEPHRDGTADQRGEHPPRHRVVVVRPPRAATGGSVRFWATSAAVPTSAASPALVRPASGWTAVASTVTSAGPMMNTVSSATASNAKAVRRSALSGTSSDHRARHAEPICGIAGTGQRGAQVRPGGRAVELDGRHRAREPEHEDADAGRQHPALPEPVDEPGLRHGERRVGHQEGRRHRAGQRVGTGPGRHQEHDAEADHRDRQPGHQPGSSRTPVLRAGPAPGGRSSASVLILGLRPMLPHDRSAPVRRPAAGLLRWPGEARGRAAVPGERDRAAAASRDERLEEVGEHYYLFGGRSPINDQNRELIAAIEEDLGASGIDLPVYWGNRNWDPYLADALRADARPTASAGPPAS